MADRWAIMPWVNSPEMTWTAVEDLLAQSLPGVRVLLISQGASREDREEIDRRIDRREDTRVLPWHWNPGVPSLSAVWNRALEFVWELGGEAALVCNNDLRLSPDTYGHLLKVLQRCDALFVSAVGVREGQFNRANFLDVETYTVADAKGDGHPVSPGGPDFSCFLISRAGHAKYPFDESFIPAFCEDLDAHRRYMLGGDGDRIFSVNLPYLHYASQTIKHYTPEQRQRFDRGFASCKAYYARKWGGPVNEEVYFRPFGVGEMPSVWANDYMVADGSPTTPALQDQYRISRRPTDAPHDPHPAP